ncbi:uncharacterized protein LOC129805229 [Phlebotomus papatasi]|uniref:uncharacterized protein LOC129805229 n=1 Tax=Phlebotomus papatasi TaxID=29031 RepID=UPI0024839A59|nr:uncharacterized protein LOC129805229 [Phlebotomus papatasi]
MLWFTFNLLSFHFNYMPPSCLPCSADIFNYEKPPIENEYFDVNEEGIICPCLPECSRIDYSVELFENLGMETGNDSVALDINFKSSTMLRYRTDVTFGWLDLMVAFGGIAGLFLGCSLLSGAELVYYLTIGLFWHNTNTQPQRPPKYIQRTPTRINTISHGIEHVQQQWRLAKGNMFIVEATQFPLRK